MDLQTYRETSLQTWDEMAPGWEDRREWLLGITGSINEWLAGQVDPQPGQSILDVAAGTGDLGFIAAERVGEEGSVLCTDFSPEMLEAARRNGERRGLSNVEYRVLDAERMDLDDGDVDGVLCRWGYMLMADPAAALKETRRVLRSGGPLAFAVWTTPDRNPWAAVPAMMLVQRGHMPPPEPTAPGMFAMGDPGRIRELVSGAGFGEPELEEITVDWRYANFEDLWDALTRITGMLAQTINALSDDERQATRAAIMENVAQFRDSAGSYTMPGSTWGVLVR